MSSRPSSRSSGDVFAVAIAGLVLGLGLLVWAWGGVAGVLFGDGWPHLQAGEIAGILVRLPGSLTHPALAWPAAERSRLPGTAGFYVALMLVGAAVVALA
ncbi:MAG TPA: hypothetical protein VIJ20_04695, partial [Solirubrobacteraceae bacterium]